MRYSNREEQNKAAQSYIDILTECAGMYQELRKAFYDFDGKCYNCRFDKALKQIKPGIFVRNEKLYMSVYYYCNGRDFTLAYINKKDMQDGKRINAEKMTESARERRENHLKEANSIKYTMDHIDSIEADLRALERAIKAITDSIGSYTAKDIYGLNAYVRYN